MTTRYIVKFRTIVNEDFSLDSNVESDGFAEFSEYKNSRITIDYNLVYKKPKNRSLFQSTIKRPNNIIEFKTLNSKSINIYDDLPRHIDSFSKFKDSIFSLYNIPYV